MVLYSCTYSPAGISSLSSQGILIIFSFILVTPQWGMWGRSGRIKFAGQVLCLKVSSNSWGRAGEPPRGLLLLSQHHFHDLWLFSQKGRTTGMAKAPSCRDILVPWPGWVTMVPRPGLICVSRAHLNRGDTAHTAWKCALVLCMCLKGLLVPRKLAALATKVSRGECHLGPTNCTTLCRYLQQKLEKQEKKRKTLHTSFMISWRHALFGKIPWILLRDGPKMCSKV